MNINEIDIGEIESIELRELIRNLIRGEFISNLTKKTSYIEFRCHSYKDIAKFVWDAIKSNTDYEPAEVQVIEDGKNGIAYYGE